MSHDASVEQQILATIDKWVEQELRPIAREHDQADEYPTDLVEQMKELGLFGATISEEYGGLGLSAATYGEGRTATQASSLCGGGTGTVVASNWCSVADDCGAVAGIIAHHDVGRTRDHGILGIINAYCKAAGSSITSRVSYRVALSTATYGEGGATA